MSTSQHINSLPNELLSIIIEHMSLQDLIHCSQVDTRWFNIVRENLLRTKSCALVRDESSCDDFNSNGKDNRGLILNDVNLWNRFSVNKLACIESLYLTCGGSFSLENLRRLLTQCENLTELTLQADTPLEISHIELLLSEVKELKNICLLLSEVTEDQRKELLEFFNDCHLFYDEVVIEILNPRIADRTELIYICSNKTQVNAHVRRDHSHFHIGHVSPALVEDILSNSGKRVRKLEIVGDISTDGVLDTICDKNIEELSLNSLSSENEAWKRFFNGISRGSTVLKALSISHCSNITDEELKQLESLHLSSLYIDFSSCTKISILEQFLNSCLSHVAQLKVRFEYDPNVVNSLLTLLNTDCNTVVTRDLVLDILRVNHCSEDVSYHMTDIKSNLENLASQYSMHISVAEIFTCITQNV